MDYYSDRKKEQTVDGYSWPLCWEKKANLQRSPIVDAINILEIQDWWLSGIRDDGERRETDVIVKSKREILAVMK